jgi:hypothetical protein
MGFLGLGFTGGACGGDGAAEATYAAGDVGGAVGGNACTAVVLVGLYDDDQCENLVFSYKLDISKPCSGWTRETGLDTRDNSGTRFQCFKDRLCYTQYVETYTCDAQAAQHGEDKEARTTCIKDPTPNIWTKLLGGTENCPETPSGFQCPTGGPTSGLAAACE